MADRLRTRFHTNDLFIGTVVLVMIWAALAVAARRQPIAVDLALIALVTASIIALMARRQQVEKSRYRLLFEDHPLPMFVFDMANYRFLAVNDAACRYYGYDRAEFLESMTLADLRPPEDWPRVKAIVDSGDSSTVAYVTHRRSDGALMDVEISSHVVRWDSRPSRMVLVQDVSELRRAEQAARRSEESLRLVLESTGEGIYSLNLDNICQWCNPAAARQLGFADAGDLIGRNMHEIAHHTRADGSPYPSEDCAMLRAARAGHGVAIDNEVMWRQDGTSFHAEYRSYPIVRDGRPVGVVVNFHDIDRRLEAERALRESQARLRALSDAGVVAISVNTPDGRIIEANDALLTMLGYTRQELDSGQLRWDDTLAPEFRFHASASARLLAAGKTVPPYLSEFVRKDGSRLPALMALVPAPEGAIRMAVDMTELRRTQESLEMTERRFRLLFERNLAGVFALKTDGTVLEANPAFARLAGYATPAAIAESGTRTVFADVNALVDQVRNKGAINNQELEIHRPDGVTVPVLANINFEPSEGDLPDRVVGTVVDLTEYKVLEREFRQAQKMEGLGLLAGGIAHDFNNLLTVINGYAEMTVDSTASEKDRKHAAAILDAGRRAAALIQQLMAFGRRQTFELTVLDLNAVVRRTAAMLKRMVGENYQLRLSLDDGLCHVQADATQIEQVLMNLVVNARDAMPGGGVIDITTANIDLDQNYAHTHHEVEPGRYVMIDVTDTGMGMDEATRSRIFEPFFTTKALGRGTGLGLATVFGIVKQSGGTVSVYTEPGRGTSMKVYLPALGKNVEAESVAPVEVARPGYETILLVEDEEPVRDYAEQVLRDFGYRVLTADNGDAALRVSDEFDGGIDLLVSDIVMPGIDGPTLAERLLEQRPALRVLFVSGYPSHALETRRALAPGSAFLQKPYTIQALAAKVRSLLDGVGGAHAAAP